MLTAHVDLTKWVGAIFGICAIQSVILACVLKSHANHNALEKRLGELLAAVQGQQEKEEDEEWRIAPTRVSEAQSRIAGEGTEDAPALAARMTAASGDPHHRDPDMAEEADFATKCNNGDSGARASSCDGVAAASAHSAKSKSTAGRGKGSNKEVFLSPVGRWASNVPLSYVPPPPLWRYVEVFGFIFCPTDDQDEAK
jgi:3-deoxy-D-manno-octulosonate 8-phosphate phosphatase KdsC-like HAD superfamily phosphatase